MQGLRTALILCFLIAPVAGKSAQETPGKERLEEVEGQLEKSKQERRELVEQAADADAEIKSLTERLIASAGRLQGIEEQVTTKEGKIEQLNEELSVKKAVLLGKNKKVAEVLAALQRLSSRPVALLLVKPAESMVLARSSALLARITPKLEGEARVLRDQIVEIVSLREQIKAERQTLESNLVALAAEQAKLDELLTRRQQRRQSLETSTKDLDRRIATLATEAKDLRDLLRKLGEEADRRRKAAAAAAKRFGKALQERPAFPTARPFSSARGSLALPARGQLVERFGDQTVTGTTKGIRLRTRTGAQVVAPYDGRVVFAGPFRTYGQLLIIEHGEGYISLLAGMSRLDGVVGQWVLAGEPVGVMKASQASRNAATSSDKAPELYIEIRRFGEPINPLPWLSMGQGKVTG